MCNAIHVRLSLILRTQPVRRTNVLYHYIIKSLFYVIYFLRTVNTRPLVTEKNFIPVKQMLSVVTCTRNLITYENDKIITRTIWKVN